MTDQEGGEIRRIPGPPGLSEQQIGESPRSRLLAKQAGRSAGSTLASVGVNVNLAPVLGVLSGQDNFLQKFGRLYSTPERKVSRLGGASPPTSARGWRRPRSTSPASERRGRRTPTAAR
jgi:beta-N-acetylhexosaminidase